MADILEAQLNYPIEKGGGDRKHTLNGKQQEKKD